MSNAEDWTVISVYSKSISTQYSITVRCFCVLDHSTVFVSCKSFVTVSYVPKKGMARLPYSKYGTVRKGEGLTF